MIHEILTGMVILYLLWNRFLSHKIELSFHNKIIELVYYDKIYSDGSKSGTVLFTTDKLD